MAKTIHQRFAKEQKRNPKLFNGVTTLTNVEGGAAVYQVEGKTPFTQFLLDNAVGEAASKIKRVKDLGGKIKATVYPGNQFHVAVKSDLGKDEFHLT